LEETGYYTADLKYASEPKPVWVWSQGVHLWDERPKMPLPTPDELGVQLYFNLGRGAKGNLWFTFMKEAGDRYPATKKALQQYSRVIKLLGNDLLQSDPCMGNIVSPATVDVAPLISPDKMMVFITNTGYQINDSAYQWKDAKNITIKFKTPAWFSPVDAFEVSPRDGIKKISWTKKEEVITVSVKQLHMGMLLVFTANKNDKTQYEINFADLIKKENQ
jgi:hypothetical protein